MRNLNPLPFFLLLLLSTSAAVTSVVFAQAQECADGWIPFGDECYKHWPITDNRINESLPTPMSFFDALAYCNEFGATIAPIKNATQLSFLLDSVIGNTSGRMFWNGVYQDTRYNINNNEQPQTWRTVYNRTNFTDFFFWDQTRNMPGADDCIAVHAYGDLSKRIVGGNGAMITYPCSKRAEVVCSRRRGGPWSVTAVNQTVTGQLLAIEGQPLILAVIGRDLPRAMTVQLQTTHYTTHSGPEGEPTHCTQTKPRNPIFMNGSSTPVVASNITRHHHLSSLDTKLCKGTCTVSLFHFPSEVVTQLRRGFKYSVCFFLPYDAATPLSSDEFRWDFLPGLYVEVAESRINYYRETCERHKQLVQLMYFDATATDLARPVQSPYFFDGPIQPLNFEFKEGI